ncbi:MAG: hypothetical protein Fur0028_03740 [Bacteroidales bacterium]
MKITIDLTGINTNDLFDEVLSVDRKTNLFKDLRKVYSNKVKSAILASGIKEVEQTQKISAKLNNNPVQLTPIPSLYDTKEFLDIDFCSGYGVDFYSLTAINYQNRTYTELPSLDTFLKCKNFSIGNFGFNVDNGDYEIAVKTNDNIKLVGYTSQIQAKKRKSFIAILGVHFDEISLSEVFEKYYNEPTKQELIDVKLSTVNYPSIFLSRRTGKLFICNCFNGHIDWQWDFKRFARLEYETEILARIENVEYKDGICHLCTKTRPTVTTENSEYSGFLKKYLPYYYLENKKQFGQIFHFEKEDNIRVENDLRQYFGYPKIGEKWISETHLFHLIKEIFPNHDPIFHYRGKELQGLELDIFIPALKLGIEYQGEQHYQIIEHWGGEKGFEKRIENDKRKLELCKQNNYTLVEFTFNDDINRDFVIERLEKYISLDIKFVNNQETEIKEPIEQAETSMNKKSKNKSLDQNELIEKINAYLELRYSNKKTEDIDELCKTTLNCVNALASIFEICLTFGKFKDDWDYSKFYQHVFGPELIIKSLKTKCDYRLGLDEERGELYISTDLRHNENLRYMDDNYWKSILKLSEINGFEYDEYEFVRDERTKEFPELFKTNKSMIYRIMRKYIFDQTETHSQYVSGSVGEFKIAAKFDEGLPETIKKFCESFKIMYKLNYDLWKVTDLKTKKASH